MKSNYPCVLTIAGSDPSGGAGIQADIKAISATGGYAAAVITALTAQNTQGVQNILKISPDFVREQLDCLAADLQIAAVKIGMLHNKKIITVISEFLTRCKPRHVILDTVMVAKNGCKLLPSSTVSFLKKTLLAQASLITPNLPEAEKLLGKKITTPFAMAAAAKKLGDEFAINVLIKGGHLPATQCSDVLYEQQSGAISWFHDKRVDTQHTHGTGCTLSSAIASYLAQGFLLAEAIQNSKNYLTQAIQAGSHLQIGQGRGPVHHFYFLENSQHDICSHA
ncbi:MAG: bifunctional hydroxymethylpyrimidine kinase/phosphomethylpyrimidine kinase [Pseudomonadota bacterium]